MTKAQAIDLITQVCVMYKGTLQEHHTLQEALKIINTLVEAPEQRTGETPLVEQ